MANRPYPSFLLYKDVNGQFRWRCEAGNGKNIANCGEGYHNLADCEHGLSLLQSPLEVWETEAVTQSRR
ncbi:MAG: DUF1508 domain-containing protein [Erythrobacter sp.]|nr:DUF1508 domain-containing protein [Erythrobacter sp.]